MTELFNASTLNVGVFILGLVYVATYYFKGGNQATTDVITSLKEQHELNVKKINDLTLQLGQLKSIVEEKDKRIVLLETLIKVTPEQEQYMIDMRKFTEGVAKYMDGSTKTLGEISVFMHGINTKS